LTAANFGVYDAGVQQAIDSVEAPGTLALVLVIDRSSSVQFGTRTVLPFLEDGPDVPPGWPTLIKHAGRMLALLRPGDEAGLLTFGGRIVLHARATADHDRLRAQVAALADTVRGSEPFSPAADAVMAGASLVANRPGRPVVALLSDGVDTASWLETPDAARALQRAGITVDLMSVPRTVGHSEGFANGTYPPEVIAEATGGRAFDATAPDVAEQLATRFAELRSSYVITYTPKGVEDVDGFHEVEIRLVGVEGRVQARPGYFAGAGR
jgi:VWFA-related protein